MSVCGQCTPDCDVFIKQSVQGIRPPLVEHRCGGDAFYVIGEESSLRLRGMSEQP